VGYGVWGTMPPLLESAWYRGTTGQNELDT